MYAGVVALVAALGDATELAAAPADKSVENAVPASPPLGVEVEAVAVAEPRVPAAVSAEIAPVAQSGVIGRRVVVRVQASCLVLPWLTSLFLFLARYGLFAAAAVDYERLLGQ